MHCITKRDTTINTYLKGYETRKFEHMKGDIQEIIMDISDKKIKLIIL